MALAPKWNAALRIALLSALCVAVPEQMAAQIQSAGQLPDPVAAAKPASPISGGAEIDFSSRYVWQGIAYTRGPVQQSSAWITAGHWTFEAWGNQILNNDAMRGQLTEYSITLGYSWTRHGWTIEPSCEKWVNHPSNADTGPNTGVCYARISHHAGPFTVYTTHNLDIQSYRGAYWGDAGISREQTWGRWKLEASISGGWASSKFDEAYIGRAKNAFNLLTAGSSITVSLPHHIYLRPHFEFSRIMDRQLRQQLSSPTLWNGGLALGVSF
jgi:hypothetical protein